MSASDKTGRDAVCGSFEEFDISGNDNYCVEEPGEHTFADTTGSLCESELWSQIEDQQRLTGACATREGPPVDIAPSGQAALYRCDPIGRRMRATKLRHAWTLRLEGDAADTRVELVHSRVTGKKQVFVDGKVVYSTRERRLSFSWKHVPSQARICLRSEGGNHQLLCEEPGSPTMDGARSPSPAASEPHTPPCPALGMSHPALHDESAWVLPTHPSPSTMVKILPAPRTIETCGDGSALETCNQDEVAACTRTWSEPDMEPMCFDGAALPWPLMFNTQPKLDTTSSEELVSGYRSFPPPKATDVEPSSARTCSEGGPASHAAGLTNLSLGMATSSTSLPERESTQAQTVVAPRSKGSASVPILPSLETPSLGIPDDRNSSFTAEARTGSCEPVYDESFADRAEENARLHAMVGIRDAQIAVLQNQLRQCAGSPLESFLGAESQESYFGVGVCADRNPSQVREHLVADVSYLQSTPAIASTAPLMSTSVAQAGAESCGTLTSMSQELRGERVPLDEDELDLTRRRGPVSGTGAVGVLGLCGVGGSAGSSSNATSAVRRRIPVEVRVETASADAANARSVSVPPDTRRRLTRHVSARPTEHQLSRQAPTGPGHHPTRGIALTPRQAVGSQPQSSAAHRSRTPGPYFNRPMSVCAQGQEAKAQIAGQAGSASIPFPRWPPLLAGEGGGGGAAAAGLSVWGQGQAGFLLRPYQGAAPSGTGVPIGSACFLPGSGTAGGGRSAIATSAGPGRSMTHPLSTASSAKPFACAWSAVR